MSVEHETKKGTVELEEENQFVTLEKKGNPQNLPFTTKILEVRQGLSCPLVETITSVCPSLETIRLPSARYKRHIQQGTKVARLLEEKGIKVIPGEPRPISLDKGGHRAWRKKRQFLLNLTPEQKQLLDEVEALDFPEVRILRSYFCLEETHPHRKRLFDIALENEFSVENATARILGLLIFLGYPAKGKDAQSRLRGLERRYKRALKERERAQKKTRCSQFMPVPEGMAMDLWDRFLELTRIKNEEPNKFRSLPRTILLILNLHYGLKDGIYHKIEEVCEILGIEADTGTIAYMEKNAVKWLQENRVIGMERCKHGVLKEWCGDCNSPKDSSLEDSEEEEEVGEEEEG